MTATNHALTGTVIGLVIGEPLLAISVAVASHYVCDALPHFGLNMASNIKLKSNGFRNYLVAEAIICFLIVLALILLQPLHWQLAAVCAFAAAAPDFLSFNRYYTIRQNKQWQPGLYSKIAGGIQWFERPIGAVVEVVWLLAAVALIAPFIAK